MKLRADALTVRYPGGTTAALDAVSLTLQPGEIVGGTAAHWGCNARRFLPYDFEIRSRMRQ